MRRFARGQIALVITTLMLGACVTVSPEARLRSNLVEAGLSPPMAYCMARKMADRLNVTQLRRLQSLAGLRGQSLSAMTIDQLLYRLRAIDDPEVVATTSRAAIACAVQDAL